MGILHFLRKKRYKTSELAHLLSLANDMRAAKGDNLLTELPKSTPGNAAACVVANAFNYGCNVYPGDGIYFKVEEDAITYCKIVGVDPKRVKHNPSRWRSANPWFAPLTTELANLAHAFDNKLYSELEYSN